MTTQFIYEKGSGVRKAAVLILALGDELAREIFKRLDEDEIRQLGVAATQLNNVTTGEVIEVLGEFRDTFGGGYVPEMGAGGVFQLMVERAIGRERARALLQAPTHEDPFEFCHALDPRAVATVMAREHAQTVAIVLASLDQHVAAEIMSHFSAQRSAEVIFRMARLGAVNDDVMRDIGATLREEFEAMGSFETSGEGMDGEERAVEILKAMKQEETDALIAQLGDADEEFAKGLRSKLFIFEDLAALDPRTMQRLLREIDSKLLSVALKGAQESLQESFFGAMSTRASEMLRDDMEASGPMRVADVEAAQIEIVEVAMKLESDGVIVLPRGGSDGLV